MICTRWLEPIVKTFLDASGFSEEDFNQRFALRSLMTLEREIPVSFCALSRSVHAKPSEA